MIKESGTVQFNLNRLFSPVCSVKRREQVSLLDETKLNDKMIEIFAFNHGHERG